MDVDEFMDREINRALSSVLPTSGNPPMQLYPPNVLRPDQLARFRDGAYAIFPADENGIFLAFFDRVHMDFPSGAALPMA